MASSFELRSARRKFIYFGVILLLFTVSLLHRTRVINALADQLQMRDTSRGKADLTDSALRLTLMGVRGVAVTSLWMTAIEKQKRNEWNELEVVVDSLTHLQPRFVQPWLYQGWNLAFNVSVECDRVRDKYYYITRGINVLCRGEEKNDPGLATPPQPWPANPNMRFEIANCYLRKIGLGDENKTMRCLFELSCIPVSERDPQQFYKQGKQIDLERFRTFCENRPRVVRRLRERLIGFEKPEAVVQFLTDNKDIPGRIEDRRLTDDKRLAEFPILPPQNPKALYPYPDWHSESLATNAEDFDVFVCARAWFTYAQIPLPEPNPDEGVVERPLDPLKERLPKFTTIIFRTYPAHAQSYFAEELQKDGWFDGSGWRIDNWFDTLSGRPLVIAGASSRYNSSEAWNKAYEYYLKYGLANGIYMDPADLRKLQVEANRDTINGKRNSFAVKKLAASFNNREKTVFDRHFQRTKVERTSEAVAARKAVFVVENSHRGDPAAVKIYQERVLPQWLDLLLRHPEFRHIESIQEETYELQAKYFYQLQSWHKGLVEKVVVGAAFAVPIYSLPGTTAPLVDPNVARTLHYWQGTGVAPGDMPPLDDPNLTWKFAETWPRAPFKEATEKKGVRGAFLRDVEGPLDRLFVLEGQRVEAIKPLAMVLARLAVWPPLPEDGKTPDFAFARFVVWPPAGPNPEIGLGSQAVWPLEKPFLPCDGVAAAVGTAAGTAWPTPTFMMLSSAEQRRILTQLASIRQPPSGAGWVPLVPLPVRERTRESIPWMRIPTAVEPVR